MQSPHSLPPPPPWLRPQLPLLLIQRPIIDILRQNWDGRQRQRHHHQAIVRRGGYRGVQVGRIQVCARGADTGLRK